ncbi:MAG: heme lyase CcmF/NrfE family subunit [Planctomycetota bacterium]|jgi:cytochrome c-type biogenesis protein CcmF
MADLGHFALILGLVLSVYAILVELLGIWKKDNGLNKSALNATIASLLCLTVAVAALLMLLVNSDFSVKYVIEHTSKELPIQYKASALWAGAAGSLLLWLWLQVGFVVIVFCNPKRVQANFFGHARTIANFVSAFFFVILILDKNPFAQSVVAAVDGNGLNPLLQHPAMVLHPPTLFIGYAAFVIPFAWAYASLKSLNIEKSTSFVSQARNWVLFAWLFLTVGIVLGAWWAYEELGWGGYWAWDPVENSSLMPWLIATALLHCTRTYKQGTTIATWAIILSLVTFSLCIFGTFLTRYGLVSSIHAFPEPGLGILFLVLLICIWIAALVLIWNAHRQNKINIYDKAWQGQKFISLNNWLMVLLTFVIFVGTLFPFLSFIFSKQKISLEPDYFTKITAPGGLLLLLLLSVCPHLFLRGINKSWRTIGAALTGIVALAVWLITNQIAPAVLIVCVFAVLNIVGDYLGRYILARIKKSDSSKVRLNLRWHGSRIVHIGVILVFLGIGGSGGYEVQKEIALKPKDSVNVGGFDIVFDGIKADHGPNFIAVIADVSVYKEDVLIDKLKPSRAYYSRTDKRTSEVDIRRTLAYDLYLALTDVDTKTDLINLTILIKPLINWIWIGTIISVLGTLLILFSLYRQKTIISQSQDEGL